VRYAATRVLATILFVALSVIAAAQCGSVDRDSPEAVRKEVNRLFNKTLDAMEGTLPSGEKVTTWIPPDDSVHDQIKCLGAAAVPATAELLRSTGRSFGHTLAIRMLGWEGGPQIVPPLAELLAKSGDSLLGLKLEALEALANAPSDRALPVVEQVLRSEKNPDLLKAATRVKARLTGSGD
jgi:HEAT repeat protein